MQLFFSSTSPYARKCRVLLRELNLMSQVVEVERHPFDNSPDLLAANPLGRVPALIMPDGKALTESLQIAAFLHEVAFSDPRDWEDKRIEALANGLLDLSVARRVEMVREKAIYSAYWISRREDGISRALNVLESEARDDIDLDGIGALTLAIALDYLDFRYPESDWRSGRSGVTRVYAYWAGRESFAETKPPADG